MELILKNVKKSAVIWNPISTKKLVWDWLLVGSFFSRYRQTPALSKTIQKNIGRELQLILKDGTESQATIKEVADDHVIVTREEIRKEGKKKVKETIETHLPYDIIKEAKL